MPAEFAAKQRYGSCFGLSMRRRRISVPRLAPPFELAFAGLMLAACGGTVQTGTGSPGADATGGSGPIDNGRAGAGRTSSGGRISVDGGSTGVGGTSSRGAGGFDAGAGGATCDCGVACGPGYRSVSVPGRCCPACEACGPTNCPAMPPCGSGTVPVTLPGQCCPTACSQGSETIPVLDGGVDCKLTSTPSCLAMNSVSCPIDWGHAVEFAGLCNPPPPPGQYRQLATCDGVSAAVVVWANTQYHFFYDASGKLVGETALGAFNNCEIYDPSFTLPSETYTCVFQTNCVPYAVAGD